VEDVVEAADHGRHVGRHPQDGAHPYTPAAHEQANARLRLLLGAARVSTWPQRVIFGLGRSQWSVPTKMRRWLILKEDNTCTRPMRTRHHAARK
jgi:hypothetical protein